MYRRDRSVPARRQTRSIQVRRVVNQEVKSNHGVKHDVVSRG